MRRLATIAFLGLTAAAAVAVFAAAARSAEEPEHAVVTKDGDFEIRDYPALTIAEVTVRAARNEAGNAGFRKLAGYIFGGNAEKQKIEMTAPVMEARAGGDGQAWTIRFVMPKGVTLARAPKPDDASIRMYETPPTRYAVLRYSGLTGDDKVEAKTAELLAILKTRGLAPAGPPLLAFYDPPWTPWFMRRNEIMVPLR
jgi:SOUL heme-binding protein